MSSNRDYDSTLARIAGNVASGIISSGSFGVNLGREHDLELIAATSVQLALLIVAEVKRTQVPVVNAHAGFAPRGVFLGDTLLDND